MSKVQIFWDSDGLIYDFISQVKIKFGGTIKEIGGDAKMWELIPQCEDFWMTMPLFPHSHDLWALALELGNPIVLTGCNRGDYDRADQHKRIVWERDFKHTNIITCLSKEKALHMMNRGDILVDDTGRNIKRWSENGGDGIFFKSYDQTVEEFRRRGYDI